MVFTKNITNATLPKFLVLGLESCNMKEFPNFLQFQDELKMFFFDDNKIHGEIPTWFWNNTKESKEEVTLQNNFLTGFEQHPDVIPWQSVISLDLNFNKLQGSLPIPPPSTIVYLVNGNSFSGEIPPSMICHNSSLQILDLSDNNLSGIIPKCLSSFRDSLLVRNLSRNNFHGTIPHMMGINLKMIDLSQNHLHGLVPRSLQNCTMLEILVLGNNQMEDTFPSWLGVLPMLQVLILRSNRFHGAITVSKTNLKFPKLRIIDLSDNGFSGNLPSKYFENWNTMRMIKRENLTYMQASDEVPVTITTNSRLSAITWYMPPYMYSVTMDSKGIHRLYPKIQKAFIAIDLSNNKFGGEIPESLGRLNGLQMLNLSNNNLTSFIPSSLANLTELESFDLSQNLLSGEIPQQLIQLTFLEVLDVSHNHLTGCIPRGNQFDTFENNSYDGNSGFYVEIQRPHQPPPSLSVHGDDSKFPSGVVDCIIISLGYGSGLIVGLIIGHTLTTRYHEWFVKKFGTRKQAHFCNSLRVFNMRGNNFHGTIPQALFLKHSWNSLKIIGLSFNKLQRALPVLTPSAVIYRAIANLLTGQIPQSIAIINNLGGTIPQCLTSSIDFLMVLNLSYNDFRGQNKLYGQVPRSLANCIRLEILVFGNNEIEDSFPFWLGDLPKLQVLVLRFNKLHGTAGNLKANLKFPNLCIIDLSHNGFSGNLPSKLFQNWNAMKMKKAENLQLDVTFIYFPSQMTILYSITITSKGIPILYEKIQNGVVVVNLLNNKFEGQIPKALGSLCGLKVLSISNNSLVGKIPSSLANLTELESLDLSTTRCDIHIFSISNDYYIQNGVVVVDLLNNKFKGQIPKALGSLCGLKVLSICNNSLVGKIPSSLANLTELESLDLSTTRYDIHIFSI
ncbi:hypothetical protein ACSBR2_011840 [Camellia fascicularis]